MRARLAIAVFGAIVVGIVLARGSEGRPLPGAAACPVFPASSHWNQRVDRLPVHPRSNAIVGAIGRGDNAHADFGSGRWDGGPIGIPYARGWTSADAAGLPILPGLVRHDEVRRGRIDHALRITVPRTRRAFVYPARHFASDSRDPKLPAMGQRVRLRRGFDVSRFPPQARVVLRALKRYGALVADNGSAWYVSGVPSPRWDNDDLHSLHRVHGSDFEVVDTSRLPRRWR